MKRAHKLLQGSSVEATGDAVAAAMLSAAGDSTCAVASGTLTGKDKADLHALLLCYTGALQPARTSRSMAVRTTSTGSAICCASVKAR